MLFRLYLNTNKLFYGYGFNYVKINFAEKGNTWKQTVRAKKTYSIKN